jgi:signal transduction histidine kinase
MPERRARGPGWVRRALWGLTPQVLAIVAALLFLRVFGLLLPELPGAIQRDDLASWIAQLGEGWTALGKMALPMLLIIIGTSNVGPQSGGRRLAALTAAIVVSAGIGTLLRTHGWDAGRSDRLEMMAYVWPRYAVLGALLTFVGELYRREVAADRAAHRIALDRIALDKDLNEARLQVLQAQIEPHFLFNTLANARRLYAESPVAGRRMLDSLIRYLEVALPSVRAADSTLERDVELVTSYLQIQQIRMGARLRFEVDVPDALRRCRVPSMLLLTLVENAVKHGLGPSMQGGLISISARAQRDQLVLRVTDNGVGIRSASGSGIGLANLRARLAAEFGVGASLALSNNETHGATATVIVPMATAPGAEEARVPSGESFAGVSP